MATGAQGQLIEVEAVESSASERAPVGAAKTFRPYDQGQVLLMAPSIQDWVPDGHLARFVSDLVDEALDLSAIYAAYEDERGFPPYDPRLMVKLLVYGYATGTPSSRKLEERTYTDVAVRFLCADQHPDFRPIARFRKRHLDALAELFVRALRLCREAGLVKLGTLALDGTKLRANASRHKAMSYERMVKREAQLEAQIAAVRAQAEALLSLHPRLREDGLDRVGEAGQAVDAADQHVLQPALAKLGQHRQSELGALAALKPHPQHVALAVAGDADRQVAREVPDRLTVADLDHQRVEVDDRIDRVQKPRLPALGVLQHRGGDAADGVAPDAGPVELADIGLDLARRHAARVEGEDLLVDSGQAPLAVGHDLRLKSCRCDRAG